MQIQLKKIHIALMIGLLVFNACSLNNTENSNQDAGQSNKSSLTNPAVRFLNLTSINISLTAQQPPTPVPTFTPRPTLTPLPTKDSFDQPQSTGQILPSPTACVNKAEIVKHLSVPPNTTFHSGDHFAKVWLIKNAGTCTWTSNYTFIFSGGDLMEAMEQEIPFSSPIMPGETVELKVQMTAPQTPNTYTANWMFRDVNGNLFGTGDNSDQPLQVIIIVPFIIRNTPT